MEELGRVAEIAGGPDAARLRVAARRVTVDLAPGDSVAVNGTCVTAVEITPDGFTADVMAETLNRTTLGRLRPGDAVNLERPLTLASRLGGHLLQGHVDGVGEVVARTPGETDVRLRVRLPAPLARYLVAQGSVAVDGVSLTVASLGDAEFEVALIPTTLAATTLGGAEPGRAVNLEVDMIGKYVERLLAGRTGG